MTRAYFSFGTNLGDRADYLRRGVTIVAAADPWRLSAVYETDPVGGVAQDDFWNCVLEIETVASPDELFARLVDAETAADRRRDVRWGPRTLDVDLIWIDDVSVESEHLVVPHPRVWERRFVLVPWAELRPDLVSDEALTRASGEVRRLGTLSELH